MKYLVISVFFLVIVGAIQEETAPGEPNVGFVLAFILILIICKKLMKGKKKEPQSSAKQSGAADEGDAPAYVYRLEGVTDILEVFEDKLEMTPKKTGAAFIVRGLKGTKSIPYTSITAIQFRKADPMNGYLQFSLLGAVESGRGVIDAISDENTIFFTDKNNALATKIKNYIEEQMRAAKSPQPQKATKKATKSLPDEIGKLAKLNKEGVLSDEEFAAAKKRLIG